MKTEDLVRVLSSGDVSVDARAPARGVSAAAGWGALGAVLLMAVFLGVRADLAQAVWLPMFWVKFAFALALSAFSLVVAFRVAIPGRSPGGALWGVAVPILILWLMGAVGYVSAEPAARPELLLGQTWRWCPLLIAALSLPAFGAGVWAMRALAPSNLPLAGAAIGFAAGAIGATAYSLHCPELSPAFIGIWYVIGILIPASVGALLGPHLLRW